MHKDTGLPSIKDFKIITNLPHCEFCGATESFLDEVVTDDAGGRMFVCCDTDYCEKRQAAKKEAAE